MSLNFQAMDNLASRNIRQTAYWLPTNVIVSDGESHGCR
jgi:hypothetical protein